VPAVKFSLFIGEHLLMNTPPKIGTFIYYITISQSCKPQKGCSLYPQDLSEDGIERLKTELPYTAPAVTLHAPDPEAPPLPPRRLAISMRYSVRHKTEYGAQIPSHDRSRVHNPFEFARQTAYACNKNGADAGGNLEICGLNGPSSPDYLKQLTMLT
jgi:hypothetical protein